MDRYKKTLLVLVVFALLLGSSTAFGRAGLGDSFMRAFGMTPPTKPGGPPPPPPSPSSGTNPSLTTGLLAGTTISTQQVLMFTPYTYGYAGRI